MADGLRIEIGSPSGIISHVQGAFVNFAVDASTDAQFFVFQTDEAVTITSLGFRYGARSGTPPTYRVSLQGVNASGDNDGTVKGATNNCLATFTPPADTSINGLWQWNTTSESYTTARGEWLAIVIEYSSGTINAGNSSTFTSHHSMTAVQGVPYAIQNVAGTLTRQAGLPLFGYKSSTKTYGFVLQSRPFVGFTSTSTPDEKALKFTLPATWGATFQVVGLRWKGANPDLAGTILVTLYTGTTPLQTFTWDSDYASGGASAQRSCEIMFDEATLETLNYGDPYYIGIAPQEAATGIAPTIGANATATDWQGWAGGESFMLATRTDGGAWTDDPLSRPWINLIIKDITEPLGHRRDMVGGMIG